MVRRQGDRDKDGKLAGQLESAAQAVKYVYSQCPSYDQLVPALLNHPVSVSPTKYLFCPTFALLNHPYLLSCPNCNQIVPGLLHHQKWLTASALENLSYIERPYMPTGMAKLQ